MNYAWPKEAFSGTVVKLNSGRGGAKNRWAEATEKFWPYNIN